MSDCEINLNPFSPETAYFPHWSKSSRGLLGPGSGLHEWAVGAIEITDLGWIGVGDESGLVIAMGGDIALVH